MLARIKKTENASPLQRTATVLVGLFSLVILYYISRLNYLIFHNIAEMFSIVIAFSIFLFAWNSRRYFENFCFIFLGIAYFHIGLLDSIHTLTYEGMPFLQSSRHYATQLWIATRFMESISLLIAFSFLSSERKIKLLPVFFTFSAITALLLGTIFYWQIFPPAFVDGVGLTPFKIISEYIICSIIILAIFRLYRHKKDFDEKVFNYLFYSLIFTILSELAFTFYVSMYGFSNLVGHYFKIISFKFIYESIIATGLNRPYDLLFRELKVSEKALTEANQTKDKLFSIISHDLKSPFTTLIGFSGALIENFERLDDKTKKEFTKDIHESAEEIYDLLDNLLKWSITQTEGITHDPKIIDLAPVVEENFSLMRQSAVNKNIKLKSEIENDTLLFADINMVNTIIRNLLSNAVKYTSKGGQVTVSSKEKGRFIEVTISDTGIGISEEDLREIFHLHMKYSKLGTNKEKGTGIGLILCKDFVEKHGGKIRVESKPGEGSQFTFTLPAHGE